MYFRDELTRRACGQAVVRGVKGECTATAILVFTKRKQAEQRAGLGCARLCVVEEHQAFTVDVLDFEVLGRYPSKDSSIVSYR